MPNFYSPTIWVILLIALCVSPILFYGLYRLSRLCTHARRLQAGVSYEHGYKILQWRYSLIGELITVKRHIRSGRFHEKRRHWGQKVPILVDPKYPDSCIELPDWLDRLL